MPVVISIAGVAAVILGARLLKREWDRVNRELDATTARPRATRLRRDPKTGEWRPE